MKKLVYIILLLIVLVIGMNLGSGSDQTKSEIIQDKIEDFEQGIIDNNQTYEQNIQPNILNKLASKCNNTLDSIINKVIKSLVN